MAKTLGVIDIVWQGRAIKVEKGAKLKLGGMQNNPVLTARGVDRAEEFIASEIEAVTVLERGQKFAELYTTEEGELQVHCDTGQIYVFGDAFFTERPDMTGGEGGKMTLKWQAGEPEEIIG